MLAPNESPLKVPNFFGKLQYPLMVSPKYDGIRGLTKGGRMLSRKLIEIPSLQVQEEFTMVDHLDGELIAGVATDFGVYNRSQSHIMSGDKPGDISYYVFDYTHDDWLIKPFYQRLEKLFEVIKDFDVYTLVPQRSVENEDELLEAEAEFLEAGYEGVIAKSPIGHYKCGRGTFLQGLVYKIKREQDDEGILEDLVEKQTNNNEQTRDALGNAKRSSSKEGKVGADSTGKFKVSFKGDLISVAPGCFTADQLQDIWHHWPRDKGKYLKFRHFPHGAKDKPRQARALGFRDKMDM